MSPGKIWMTRCARFLLLLIPAFALAMPAYAFRDPRLYDSQEPGSVIVFAKFLRGVVVVDGATLPASEFEVGIVTASSPSWVLSTWMTSAPSTSR